MILTTFTHSLISCLFHSFSHSLALHQYYLNHFVSLFLSLSLLFLHLFYILICHHCNKCVIIITFYFTHTSTLISTYPRMLSKAQTYLCSCACKLSGSFSTRPPSVGISKDISFLNILKDCYPENERT